MYHLFHELPEIVATYYVVGAVAFCYFVNRLTNVF